MHILRLFWNGPLDGARLGFLVTAMAALGNVGLIALVNVAAEREAVGTPIGLRLFLGYALLMALFYLANRMSLESANALLQQRLATLQRRVCDKVRNTELRTVEALGRGRLLTTIGQETNQLAQAFPILVSASQSIVLLPLTMLYIAWLSPAAFVVVLGVTAVGLVFFTLRRRRLRHDMATVNAQESAMLDAVGHVTDGFQEIRLNADRNDALYAHFETVVGRLETTVAGIGRNWSEMLMFGNAFLYVLVGVVVLILPFFFSGFSDAVYKIAAVAIFCAGPVTSVTSAVPLLDRANIGLQTVLDLERELDAAAITETDAVSDRYDDFRTITLDRVGFQFSPWWQTGGFRVGPLDLTLRRGELVFLIGGNGGGKSTTLKLLSGLYEPSEGEVRVDGEAITRETLQSYREIFSCIFTDFHLFSRLYGLEHVDPATVTALLTRMKLDHKVTFSDGAFSTQSLSTGERKRLAMVVLLLEDRPVLVFDEWAADQDAGFRHIFYTELLPGLREQGKTVIAVTHDDRYWSYADRRIRLDLGQIVPQPPLMLTAT